LLNAITVEEQAQSVRTFGEESTLSAERDLEVIWDVQEDVFLFKGVGECTAERYQRHSFDL